MKVSVYIPCFNYGAFVKDAIDSILKQTMEDWELIVINDGSTDNSREVIEQYKHNDNIKIIHQENKGLNVTNNIALRSARGRYIMRLDGDDYLDENALLILSNTLDMKPDVDLVYPDYYEADPEGKILGLVRRKKIEEEVQLLDLPAHGACTMFRTRVLRQIGGYMEEFTCQDGYEMWLRFIQKHKPYNVNIPLFYYRQHPSSLTKNQNKILNTRRKIKRRFIEKKFNGAVPKVLGVVPATRLAVYAKNDPFVELNGKPLIWYTLQQALESKSLDRIIVSSENDEVLEYAGRFQGVIPLRRESRHSLTTARIEELIIDILDFMERDYRYEPEAVCTLYINTPLRKSYHIDWAIDTMKIFDVDTVISVQEELAHCYQHRKFGLTPVKKSSREMRLEREAIYRENGAVYLCRSEMLRESLSFVGKTVGHIVMLPEESVKINSDFEFWLADQVLSRYRSEAE